MFYHSQHFALILFLLCTILSPDYAQAPPTLHFDFKKLDKKDGLFNDTFNDFLYKDTYGYLWVSSTQGIYKYDGYTFKHFNADTESNGGMIGNNVQSNFYEDENGNIWFSTYTGLNKYDRLSDEVFGFTIQDANDVDVKAGYHVFHLDKAKQELWFSANKVICRYDYAEKVILEYLPFEFQSIRFFTKLDANGNVSKIYGAPWLLGSGIEVVDKNGHSWEYQRNTIEKELGKNRVSDILYAKERTWLVSNEGLLRLDQNDKLDKVFKLDDLVDADLFKGIVMDNEQMLFSTSDQGLITFDFNKDKFSRISGYLDGEQLNTSCDLHLDKDSILWAGFGAGGIGRVDIKKKSLAKKSNKLYNIKELKKIVHHERTYLLNKENELVILDNSQDQKSSHKIKLDAKIIDFVVTQNNQLILIDKNSIYSYEVDNKRLKQESKLNFDPLELIEVQGKIIISAFKGMFFWDINTKELQELEYNAQAFGNDELSFSQFFINENEFLIFNNAKSILAGEILDTSIKVNKSISHSGFVHDAVSINGDWFFVSVNGLYHLDRYFHLKKLSFQEYISDMGFNSVVPLNQNKLLLGNSEGIYSYNVSDSTLYKLNYLIDDELNVIPNGLQYAANDNLLVADDEVLFMVNKKDLEYESKKPQLKVKSVEINNRVYNRTDILVEKESKIVMGQNDKFFGLELQCKDDRLDGGGQIRYKDSRNNQWQNIVNGKLGFENLTPGNFNLSFVALDKNMNASEVKTLHVKVKEPFYRSRTFYLLMAMLVAGISFATGKIIEKIKGNKLQRELVLRLAQEQERNRIASMIHDDMGAILSTIQFASEDLSMDVKDESLKNKALSIQNDAKDLLSRMRTNIWALKSETKALTELCRELRKSAFDQISALNINLKYPIDEELPLVNLSGAACMEIMLIQKESLNNIVKHAQAENILITAKSIDNKFILSIKDDGKGISDDHTPGMGTTNMTKRAKAVNGELFIENSTLGVTVRLEVPVKSGN